MPTAKLCVSLLSARVTGSTEDVHCSRQKHAPSAPLITGLFWHAELHFVPASDSRRVFSDCDCSCGNDSLACTKDPACVIPRWDRYFPMIPQQGAGVSAMAPPQTLALTATHRYSCCPRPPRPRRCARPPSTPSRRLRRCRPPTPDSSPLAARSSTRFHRRWNRRRCP